MVAYKDSRERKSSEDPHSVVILANKKNPALPGLDFSFSTFTFSSRRCAGIKVQSSLREQEHSTTFEFPSKQNYLFASQCAIFCHNFP